MKKNRRWRNVFFSVFMSIALVTAYIAMPMLDPNENGPAENVYAASVADVDVFDGCTDYNCGSFHIDEIDSRITNNEQFRFLIHVDNHDGVPYRITFNQPSAPPFDTGGEYSFDIDCYDSVITRPRWQFSSKTPWKNGTFEAILSVHIEQITSVDGVPVSGGKEKDITIRMHFDVFGVDKYSGWKKVGNEWRFFKNGASVTNSWQKDGSGWMYLDSNGRITKSNWAKDSKEYCWLEANGYVSTATKWVKLGGDWYHITKGYRDQNKWMKDSKGWCYLGADGKMVTNGWAKDSKGYCWIASDGYMPVATKWIKYDGGWYHITKGYRDQSKWMKDSKGWCWLQADGRMLTNGWAKDSKGNCWIGPSGYMLETTRLIEYAGDTYGIEKGYMVTGRTIRIDGTDYTFDNDGKLIEAPDAGDQAGVSINRSEVDFGTVSIPIGENRRTLELNNEDNVPYRITIEQPGNPLFWAVIYQEDVEAGTSAQLRVFLSSDNQEALETGIYEDVLIVHAEQISEVGGSVVPEGKSVDMEVPLRVTIAGAAEDCTLTIDMQGHGENVSIHGLEPGTSVSEVYNEWLTDNYGENGAPVAAGYVYNGINLLPLLSYSDWEGYMADKEALSDMVLTTDQTVYAMWLPEITHVEATLDAPVAGEPAATVPVVHLDSQSNCYVVPEKTTWAESGENGLGDAQGTFEEGKQYYTTLYFMPVFPYGFSRTDLRLIINDETYYPDPDYDNGISNFIIYDSDYSNGVGIRSYPYIGLCAIEQPSDAGRMDDDFFVKPNGEYACNEWINYEGNRYYFGDDGHMVKNNWAEDTEGIMWMDANGRITKDKWLKIDGDWYYFKTNGYKAVNEWAKDSNGWMWMDANGNIWPDKWVHYKGYWYYMKPNGYMATSEWIDYWGCWYYFKTNGTMVAGEWLKIGGEWYYFKSGGEMAYLEWVRDNTGWMYLNDRGRITKGHWVNSGDDWYYLKTDGYMATGTQTINGKTYRFDSSGRWIQ